MGKMLIAKTDVLDRVVELEYVEIPDRFELPVLVIRPGSREFLPTSSLCESIFGTQDPGAIRVATWQRLAQLEAVRFIADRRAADSYPSQLVIAEHVAKKFRSEKTFGPMGKPLTAAYIKRHALDGIYSSEMRRRSTVIKRSK